MQYLTYLHRSSQSGFAGNCHPEEDQSCLRQRRSLFWDHFYTQPHQAVLDWAAFLHNLSLQRHQPARNHKGVKVSVYWYIISGWLHLTPSHGYINYAKEIMTIDSDKSTVDYETNCKCIICKYQMLNTYSLLFNNKVDTVINTHTHIISHTYASVKCYNVSVNVVVYLCTPARIVCKELNY